MESRQTHLQSDASMDDESKSSLFTPAVEDGFTGHPDNWFNGKIYPLGFKLTNQNDR